MDSDANRTRMPHPLPCDPTLAEVFNVRNYYGKIASPNWYLFILTLLITKDFNCIAVQSNH